MASRVPFRGIQQQLSQRGVRCQFVSPYADGRCRIAVWHNTRPRFLANHTDDQDMAYVMGIRMAAEHDAKRAAGTSRPIYA